MKNVSVFTLFAKILKQVVFIIIRYFQANDVWSFFWNSISFCQISNRYSVASIIPIIQAIRVYMVLLHITKTISATRSKVFWFCGVKKTWFTRMRRSLAFFIERRWNYMSIEFVFNMENISPSAICWYFKDA